ncbi:heme A synthase [Actinomadura coerulea]|uniref:Heme A synthase n=1 Tax=Actinomadura coerulea TaxID=46159 RepID=A0A7X0G3A9_9ACTN|nr:hypothetical protein [Actinomadura coerulea]MBB6398679.1 heme A synthase [Actinomadura coerulea]GGQ00116.1 hypothetical protein GCM10010187_14840 [Actinomadura coerulea]
MKILRITLRIAMVLLALATTIGALNAARADAHAGPFWPRPAGSRP